MRHGWKRAVTLGLLASLTTGCMMWHPASLMGPGLSAQDVGSRVRVTRVDGTTVVLEAAAMRADSVAGIEEGGVWMTVPVSDVQELEAWRWDPGFMLMPAFIVAVVVIPKVLLRSLRGPDTGVEPGGT